PPGQDLQPAGALLDGPRHAFEAGERFARRAVFPPAVHGSLRFVAAARRPSSRRPRRPFAWGRAISSRGCSSLLAFFANCDRRARPSRRVVARAATHRPPTVTPWSTEAAQPTRGVSTPDVHQ